MTVADFEEEAEEARRELLTLAHKLFYDLTGFHCVRSMTNEDDD